MTRQISLTRGLFALVDDADYDLVSEFSWVAVKGGYTFYANCRGLSMHRLLAGPADNQEVDHRDGNGLNNTRSNLRVCSHKENVRNKTKRIVGTSRFKGISRKPSGSFIAVIEQNGVPLNLGIFHSEFAAARQYDRAARVFFGQFAKTNESMGLFKGAEDRVFVRKKRVGKHSAFKSEMERVGITPRIA